MRAAEQKEAADEKQREAESEHKPADEIAAGSIPRQKPQQNGRGIKNDMRDDRVPDRPEPHAEKAEHSAVQRRVHALHDV